MGVQIIRIISLASFLIVYLNANAQELKQSAFTRSFNLGEYLEMALLLEPPISLRKAIISSWVLKQTIYSE